MVKIKTKYLSMMYGSSEDLKCMIRVRNEEIERLRLVLKRISKENVRLKDELIVSKQLNNPSRITKVGL